MKILYIIKKITGIIATLIIILSLPADLLKNHGAGTEKN
jgi:hypothetical protein